MKELDATMKRLAQNHKGPVYPRRFLEELEHTIRSHEQVPQFRWNQQQGAREVLCAILEEMERTATQPGTAENKIKIRETRTCLTCSHSTAQETQTQFLLMCAERSLTQMAKKLCAEEPLEQLFCAQCGEQRRATQRTNIVEAPQVIMVVLNRMADTEGGTLTASGSLAAETLNTTTKPVKLFITSAP